MNNNNNFDSILMYCIVETDENPEGQ